MGHAHAIKFGRVIVIGNGKCYNGQARPSTSQLRKNRSPTGWRGYYTILIMGYLGWKCTILLRTYSKNGGIVLDESKERI